MQSQSLRFLGVAAILAQFATSSSHACGTGGPLVLTNVVNSSSYTVNALNSSGTLGIDSLGLFGQAALYSAGSIVPIGTLGGSTSTLRGLNDANQAVGDSGNSDSSETLAFLYSGGTLYNLGTLGGGYSSAYAINNSGLVVGLANLTGDAVTHAFLYTNGTMLDLGELGGGWSAATAINNSGDIAGSSLTTNNALHAFFYRQGTMQDLGDLGGGTSFPTGLNASGAVIGQSTFTDGNYHAFEYSGGKLYDLGTVGGVSSTAIAINNAGQVIGSYTNSDGTTYGFITGPSGSVSLGNIGGQVYPAGINNSGMVVGTAENTDTANSGLTTAFLWTNGVMVDLNTLLPTNTTWYLLTASYINDSGRIVGLGFVNNYAELDWYELDLNANETQPPVIVSQPATLSVSVNWEGKAHIPNVLSQVVVSDSCAPSNTLKLTQSPKAGTIVGPGQYTVTVTVSDAGGNTTQGTTLVNAQDTTPPVIVYAPGFVRVFAGSNGTATVPDVTGLVVAHDNVTPPNALVITQSPAAGTPLGVGEHDITVSVQDAAGNTRTHTTHLKVKDNTPPVIQSVTASPNVLSPANNQGVPVTLTVAAVDNCDPTPTAQIIRVESNGLVWELKGRQDAAIQVTGPLAVTLPAQLNPHGGQRTYRITVRVTDASGNSSLGNVTVTVPKPVKT